MHLEDKVARSLLLKPCLDLKLDFWLEQQHFLELDPRENHR